MKAVESAPARNPGWRASAARNGRLVVTPRTVYRSRAVSSRSRASSRSRPGGDELRDHGVVPHRDLAALLHPVVDPDAAGALRRAARRGRPRRRRLFRGTRPGCAGRAVPQEPSRRGQEVALGVLRVDPRLHRPAVHSHVVLGERQRLAGRDPDHPLHEVEPGHRLRHRVLHLEPGVHLEEIEPALRVHDELDGSRRHVAGGTGKGHRLRPHPRPQPFVDEGGRRLLEDLLVPALHRALALPEVEHRAVPIAKDLDLDVPRALHVALDENPPVAEARERLVRGPAEPFADLVLPGRDPHPLAAASRGGLEHHRVADLAGGGHRLVRAGEGPVHPGDRVDPPRRRRGGGTRSCPPSPGSRPAAAR